MPPDAEHQDDSLNVKRASQTLAKEAAEIAKRLRERKKGTAVTSVSSSKAPGSPGPTASGPPEQFNPYAADPDDPPAPEKGGIGGRRTLSNHNNMWVGRFAWRDIGRAVGHLATKVSRWTPLEDKKLHRLMSYLHHSREFRQIGFIGDELEDLRLGLFTDADFAGDKATMKSTFGVVVALYGPNSFFPIEYLSRFQKISTLSTIEVETVAAALGLKTVGIPAIDLWSSVLGRDVILDLFQDN